MKIKFLWVALLSLPLCALNKPLITLSPEQAKIIGNKIWRNECANKVEGLTSWNEGEKFASLGIGHFIWHPPRESAIFTQSFPSLITFLQKHGAPPVPAWLKKALVHGCPWHSREHFMQEINSPMMQELRTFLLNTIDLQTAYMIDRLNTRLPKIFKKLPLAKQQHVKKQFNRIIKNPQGIYALIDYLNFKGEGIEPKETYNNVGWGLMNILENMQGTQEGLAALEEFVQQAKLALEKRVQNAPASRDEKRWLPGWNNRLNTYLNP